MEQQRILALKGGQHEHDFDLLKKIYEEWHLKNAIIASNDKLMNLIIRDPDAPAHHKMAFNEQVRAYLLVYTQRLRRPSETQRKQGFPEFIFKFTKKDDNSLARHICVCTDLAQHYYFEKGITALL